MARIGMPGRGWDRDAGTWLGQGGWDRDAGTWLG